jgi:hypothetical protein
MCRRKFRTMHQVKQLPLIKKSFTLKLPALKTFSLYVCMCVLALLVCTIRRSLRSMIWILYKMVVITADMNPNEVRQTTFTSYTCKYQFHRNSLVSEVKYFGCIFSHIPLHNIRLYKEFIRRRLLYLSEYPFLATRNSYTEMCLYPCNINAGQWETSWPPTRQTE